MATHCSILAWRIPWTEELAGYSPWDRKESDMTKQVTYMHTHTKGLNTVKKVQERLWKFKRQIEYSGFS